MSKKQNITRLNELAVTLGRPADTTGTDADIAQRVREWEEEAEALSEEGAGADTSEGGEADTPLAQPGGLVLVRMLRTTHLNGTDENGRDPVSVAVQGRHVLVAADDVEILQNAGLVAVVETD